LGVVLPEFFDVDVLIFWGKGLRTGRQRHGKYLL
jgi:hypothetical protein